MEEKVIVSPVAAELISTAPILTPAAEYFGNRLFPLDILEELSRKLPKLKRPALTARFCF
jgi:hypothetical protein